MRLKTHSAVRFLLSVGEYLIFFGVGLSLVESCAAYECMRLIGVLIIRWRSVTPTMANALWGVGHEGVAEMILGEKPLRECAGCRKSGSNPAWPRPSCGPWTILTCWWYGSDCLSHCLLCGVLPSRKELQSFLQRLYRSEFRNKTCRNKRLNHLFILTRVL